MTALSSVVFHGVTSVRCMSSEGMSRTCSPATQDCNAAQYSARGVETLIPTNTRFDSFSVSIYLYDSREYICILFDSLLLSSEAMFLCRAIKNSPMEASCTSKNTILASIPFLCRHIKMSYCDLFSKPTLYKKFFVVLESKSHCRKFRFSIHSIDHLGSRTGNGNEGSMKSKKSRKYDRI